MSECSVECVGGPQDGLHLVVPPHCNELRFPVALDVANFAQTTDPITPVPFPVAIYQRGDFGRFFYGGQQG